MNWKENVSLTGTKIPYKYKYHKYSIQCFKCLVALGTLQFLDWVQGQVFQRQD